MLQMGLKVISMDGLAIKKVRQYVLRCHSCYKFCKQAEKKFCPACGNSTLVKVSMEVNTEGSVSYSQTQRIKLRGSVYSIPLPRGGRNNHDLIFAEDQFMERQKKAPRSRGGDVFEDGYAFGALQSGSKKVVDVGYGRRNPNVARRKIGKKNRSICNM
jgi:RNA-binding protein NOB1